MGVIFRWGASFLSGGMPHGSGFPTGVADMGGLWPPLGGGTPQNLMGEGRLKSKHEGNLKCC